MAQETKALMTAEEFARLPDGGMRRELVYGEVIEMTPGGAEHSAIGINIAAALRAHVRESGDGVAVGADCGFVLSDDPDLVRAPDVAFIDSDRLPDGGIPQGFFPGAPYLAVEVVSQTDSASDLQQKVNEYLATGTRLVWVVYPNTKQVVVHQPGAVVSVFSEEQTLTADPVLPGLSIPVGEIFTI